jgi:DNA-binding MarR family transcriptional regulator
MLGFMGSPGMAARRRKQKETDSRDSLSASMGYLVRRTFQAFTRTMAPRLAAHDISLSMWFFLRLLWEGDGRTQKDIGTDLGLAPPTTVSAMDNLEKRGLIVRKRNALDRREIHVYLTPAGHHLKTELSRYAHEVNAIALRNLTRRESQMLRTLLLKVNESLDTEKQEQDREVRTEPRRTQRLPRLPGSEFDPVNKGR